MRASSWLPVLFLIFLIPEEGLAAPLSPTAQITPAKDAQRASSMRVTARQGCADRLVFAVDAANLGAPSPAVSAAEAEQARGRIEGAFRRVASQLCVAGTLPVTTFLMYDRVVLQHAEGAMEPTLFPDGDRPRTLIYQLFDVYRAPVDEALLREGMLCLANPRRQDCYLD